MSDQNSTDLPEVPSTDPTVAPEVKPAEQGAEHSQGPDFEPTNPSDVAQPDSGNLENHTVHIPSLISDQFGIAASTARQMVMMGEITFDGEELPKNERLDPPREKILGKEIKVTGEFRSLIFTYSG